MFTASANGEVMPGKFGPGFDVICKEPVFDSKSFIQNVVFDSYRQNYTGSALASCGNNFIFKPHPSTQEMIGSANLYSSQCTNCDADSYLSAPNPNPADLGWFGGCGDILCTGLHNYLVQDFTGTFFGFKGTLLPNPEMAPNELNCNNYSTPMNAYVCQNRTDFAVLEYESKAPDFQTRIMWPVSITADGYNYTTVTNAWREWEWLGNEPQNKRFGRFVSVVGLNRTHNITFLSEPPVKINFQLQTRNPNGGNPQNWAGFRLHYPLPNSIRLLLNGVIVDPILLTDVNYTTSGLEQNLNTSACGSYAYLYTNYTISFIVTESPDCLVTIELTESIQLTTHFAMNISDFFSSNSSVTNFINNLCALLDIVDTSRVKVVGVFSGSTAVTAVITPSSGSVSANGTNVTDPSIATLSATLSTSISSGAFATGMAPNLGPVIGASSVYQPLSTDSTVEEDSKVGLIAGLVIASVIIAAVSAVVFVYCVRKRSKIVDSSMLESQEFSDKDGASGPVVTLSG
jgi:hypothetical protein